MNDRVPIGDRGLREEGHPTLDNHAMSPRMDRMTAPQIHRPQQIPLAWRNMLHGVLSALYEAHPIALYQLVVFARYPSWRAGALVILSLALNHIAVGITISVSLLMTRRKLIRGCLGPMSGCTFTRYQASQFLKDAYDSVENAPVRQLMRKARMAKASVNERIQLYVVTAPELIPQLSCYAGPYFVNSFIFITDPPAEITGIRRFFVLHEIGHSQMTTFAQPSALRLWRVPQVFLFLWIAATGTGSAAAVPIAIAYLSTVLLWWQDWDRRVAKGRLLDEMLADYFALNYLPSSDLALLATNRRLSSLLDKDMDPLQNMIRLARLRENIDLALSGNLKAAEIRTFTEFTTPPWRVVLAGIGITAMTGLLGAPPRPETLLRMLVLGGVLLVVWNLLVMLVVYGDIRITDRLHGRRPA